MANKILIPYVFHKKKVLQLSGNLGLHENLSISHHSRHTLSLSVMAHRPRDTVLFSLEVWEVNEYSSLTSLFRLLVKCQIGFSLGQRHKHGFLYKCHSVLLALQRWYGSSLLEHPISLCLPCNLNLLVHGTLVC